jgi:hypothetical protein
MKYKKAISEYLKLHAAHVNNGNSERAAVISRVIHKMRAAQ